MALHWPEQHSAGAKEEHVALDARQHVPAPGLPDAGQVAPNVEQCVASLHGPPSGDRHFPPLQVLLVTEQSALEAQ